MHHAAYLRRQSCLFILYVFTCCLYASVFAANLTNEDIQCVPKKAAPYVKYIRNTHNTEQKSLKITENTLTSIWTLCATLQVSSVSGSWHYYLLSATISNTPKMQFSKTKLSVLNPMNSLQSNHGYKLCSKCPPSAFTHSRSRVRYW